MQQEVMKILEMVKDGTISAEQGADLIAAVNSADKKQESCNGSKNEGFAMFHGFGKKHCVTHECDGNNKVLVKCVVMDDINLDEVVNSTKKALKKVAEFARDTADKEVPEDLAEEINEAADELDEAVDELDDAADELSSALNEVIEAVGEMNDVLTQSGKWIGDLGIKITTEAEKEVSKLAKNITSTILNAFKGIKSFDVKMEKEEVAHTEDSAEPEQE